MVERRRNSRVREKFEKEDFILRQISKGEIDNIDQYDLKNKNIIRIYLSSTFSG
jgi:hypothetical protein